MNRRTVLKYMALTFAASNTSTAQSNKKVVVIGSGLSGLAAAIQLKKAGVNVTILEGRNRIGGRTHSDKSLGATVDLGASWIHGIDGNPLYALSKKLKLTAPVTNQDAHTVYQNGKTIQPETEAFEDMMDALADWGEQQEKDASIGQAMNEYFKHNSFTPEKKQELIYLANSNLEHEYSGDIADMSLWSYDEGAEVEGDDVLIGEGYSSLVGYLASNLDIRLSQVVSKIEQSNNKITVYTQNNSYSADAVLVTVPLGVLKAGKIKFSPALPTEKTTAIQKLGMGLLNKVYLKFSEVFWDDTDWIGYIGSPEGEFAEWLNVAHYFKAPVIMGFNAGKYAWALENKSDKDIVQQALTVLKSMYGTLPELKGSIVTRHGRDPFSLGAYSFYAVGSSPKHRKDLAKPVGRVFFAGEATHLDYPSTTHGAYLSGERAAREIQAALL